MSPDYLAGVIDLTCPTFVVHAVVWFAVHGIRKGHSDYDRGTLGGSLPAEQLVGMRSFFPIMRDNHGVAAICIALRSASVRHRPRSCLVEDSN